MIRVLHTLPDLHVGGVASLLKRILENFNDENFEHHLCYFGKNEALLHDFQCLPIKIHKITHGGGLMKLAATSYKFNNLVKTENIDIVHNHLFLDRIVTGFSSFFNKAKIITSIHTTNTLKENGSLKRKGMVVFEDTVGRISSNVFLAVSDTVKNVAVKERFVPRSKVQTIYSGVPIPERIKPNLGEPINLISIGRMVKSKGFSDLIEVVYLLSKRINIHLKILGDGPLRAELEGRVKDLHLSDHITFLGFSNEVQKHLEKADIFVSCSKEEGFGLSVVEALSYSLPVFAYSIPIFEEISGPGKTMILAEVGDVKGLSEKIFKLVKNPDEYSDFSRASFERANLAFNIRQTANNYMQLYKNVSSKN